MTYLSPTVIVRQEPDPGEAYWHIGSSRLGMLWALYAARDLVDHTDGITVVIALQCLRDDVVGHTTRRAVAVFEAVHGFADGTL